ncbi:MULTISPECIES: ectoine utilization protein EutC [Actibacterium]|uniref:Ornithine cyclodeaminase n=1 Tax=Actibacterium naphthalenivorans TaxID=1614693 RepID=A0A840CE49_9RHOB|nr:MULTISPECIES: ectoine utilization protein EutC [Actibacterium]ALG90414.1 ectoine utilization protein EutC [Actibacterium sp. EMB200-NS6]MBB4022352.1 ornithine cyclodeaminase [Actibacterium naphthalenivorans]
MVEITLLSEADLRRCVALDDQAVECVEDGFRALGTGTVVMPPILSMAIREANGEVDVKTAYVPGLPSFAIKVSPGFFDNPALGLASTSGLMMLFCARTGQVQALLLDNGYLTDIRTAAAGAVAARHLARADASHACILGAGMQARMQLRALSLVRPIRRATFWARDPARADAAAREMGAELGIKATACADPATCVAQADVIVTTTPATRPILLADWLRPGQHVTAMGSDQHGKNELDPASLARADLYVPDRLSQTRALGELRSAVQSGALPADARFPELGDIVAGTAPGRATPEQITIADLTGTGVQDTVIAIHALRRARAQGLGTLFNT